MSVTEWLQTVSRQHTKRVEARAAKRIAIAQARTDASVAKTEARVSGRTTRQTTRAATSTNLGGTVQAVVGDYTGIIDHAVTGLVNNPQALGAVLGAATGNPAAIAGLLGGMGGGGAAVSAPAAPPVAPVAPSSGLPSWVLPVGGAVAAFAIVGALRGRS